MQAGHKITSKATQVQEILRPMKQIIVKSLNSRKLHLL